MRRIIFLNRYFFPDFSATSQILGDLAFHLAETGSRVAVVTSRQRYDDAQADLSAREEIGGVEIHRIATTQFGRSGLIGRGFDYLSFYRSAYRQIMALAEPGDVLVTKTDPPLICVPALRAARRRGLHLINWLADLYPEVAAELGVPLLKGPVAGVLFHLRNDALRAAAMNVVLSHRMGDIVRAHGVSEDRVRFIHNWCDDGDITPLAPADTPLRREWGIADRFVVGYSGNLGRGHEFETLLGAAERLRDLPHILFLFIGGGHLLGELVRQVKERRLGEMFRFMPYQDRARLKHSLAVPDLHWISQRPELEGMIVPSKFYGIAAAGRPIACITAPSGEFARLVTQHSCGIVVEPGNPALLAEKLRHLATAPAELAGMGRRARLMLDTLFTRRLAFDQWREMLETIG
ncbi:MAG TPA: glycosyltransferase family 4 protein [Stellaceae bacterium]|jgi:glycosyltransferase involved in cell wall biosynthesis|nr:glycosyltransferase family 4 protein [Stellaceae bacterium]